MHMIQRKPSLNWIGSVLNDSDKVLKVISAVQDVRAAYAAEVRAVGRLYMLRIK